MHNLTLTHAQGHDKLKLWLRIKMLFLLLTNRSNVKIVFSFRHIILRKALYLFRQIKVFVKTAEKRNQSEITATILAH